MSIALKGDLRNFLQQIALISGLDVDVDPSISRNVTVHLKDVPWDLALDVVLNNSGLTSELQGKVLRIARANPLLGQDHILLGTVTIEGKVMEFNLQNPRTTVLVKALDADGTLQNWPVEWQSADYLKEIGVKPNTLKVGDQVIVIGNLTRRNTIDLVIVKRLSDGFSWGDVNAVSSAPSDGVMFVSSTSR